MEQSTIIGCVIIKRGLVLLLDRQQSAQVELPGGRQKPGENPVETLRRKIQEELGCQINVGNQIGAFDANERGKPVRYEWYLGELPKGTVLKKGDPQKFAMFFYTPAHELHRIGHPSPALRTLVAEIAAGHVRLRAERDAEMRSERLVERF